jgi:hypothetical protein
LGGLAQVALGSAVAQVIFTLGWALVVAGQNAAEVTWLRW